MKIKLDQKKMHKIEQIAEVSQTFDEFWLQAEDLIWEHYKELSAQKQVFVDDVEDYAKKIWDDLQNAKMPF